MSRSVVKAVNAAVAAATSVGPAGAMATAPAVLLLSPYVAKLTLLALLTLDNRPERAAMPCASAKIVRKLVVKTA